MSGNSERIELDNINERSYPKKKSIMCKLTFHKWESEPYELRTKTGELYARMSGVLCTKCGLHRSGCKGCGKKLYVRNLITRVFENPAIFQCPKCGRLNSSYSFDRDGRWF